MQSESAIDTVWTLRNQTATALREARRCQLVLPEHLDSTLALFAIYFHIE
jgi:hypothetical protein